MSDFCKVSFFILSPSLLFDLLTDDVQSHGQNDQAALDDQLIVGGEAQDVQCVTHDADNDGADDGTQDRTGTAGSGVTANHDSGDGVHFIAGTCGGVTGSNTGAQNDTCQACQQTGDGIVSNTIELHTDTAHLSSVHIVTDEAELTTILGLADNEDNRRVRRKM